MAATIPQNRARLGGSGFTIFSWRGAIIGSAQQVANQSPQPVAQPTPIQPLDAKYAREILLPQAALPGTLTLQLIEFFNSKVWDRLKGLSGANDIVEVFQKVAALNSPIICVKQVSAPGLGSVRENGNSAFSGGIVQQDIYHGCVVSNVLDNETIEIGTMQIIKEMDIMYTHVTRNTSLPNKNQFTPAPLPG